MARRWQAVNLKFIYIYIYISKWQPLLELGLISKLKLQCFNVWGEVVVNS